MVVVVMSSSCTDPALPLKHGWPRGLDANTAPLFFLPHRFRFGFSLVILLAIKKSISVLNGYLLRRPLEEHELVTLVQLFLAHRPELEHHVLLAQQLIQGGCNTQNPRSHNMVK